MVILDNEGSKQATVSVVLRQSRSRTRPQSSLSQLRSLGPHQTSTVTFRDLGLVLYSGLTKLTITVADQSATYSPTTTAYPVDFVLPG